MPALTPFQVRIPADLPDRMDALIPYVADETDVGRVKSAVSRSDVARMALDLGIDVLSRRAGLSDLVKGGGHR